MLMLRGEFMFLFVVCSRFVLCFALGVEKGKGCVLFGVYGIDVCFTLLWGNVLQAFCFGCAALETLPL